MLDLAWLEMAPYQLGRVRARKGEDRSLDRWSLGESPNGGQRAPVLVLPRRIVVRKVGANELRCCCMDRAAKLLDVARLRRHVRSDSMLYRLIEHTDTIESSSL